MSIASAPPLWESFAASVRGATHTANDMPNQDAVGVFPTTGPSECLVLALSDGHGSSNYRRSDVGARLAVDTVRGIGEQFLELAITESLRALKSIAEEWVPRELVRSWVKAVDEHLAAHPDEDEEVPSSCGADPRAWYGATVLGAVLLPGLLVFWQLGDGDVVLVASDGKATRPLAPSQPQLGVETDSLLSDDAWGRVRVHWLPVTSEPPSLVLLASDGLANSYSSNAAFVRFGPDMLTMIRDHGLVEVRPLLSHWLQRATTYSGDDVSLVGACRKGVAREAG